MFEKMKRMLRDDSAFALLEVIYGEFVSCGALDGIGWALTCFGILFVVMGGLMGAIYDLCFWPQYGLNILLIVFKHFPFPYRVSDSEGHRL